MMVCTSQLEDAIPCEEATLEDFQSFLTQCITQSFVAAFQQAGVNISGMAHLASFGEIDTLQADAFFFFFFWPWRSPVGVRL